MRGHLTSMVSSEITLAARMHLEPQIAKTNNRSIITPIFWTQEDIRATDEDLENFRSKVYGVLWWRGVLRRWLPVGGACLLISSALMMFAVGAASGGGGSKRAVGGARLEGQDQGQRWRKDGEQDGAGDAERGEVRAAGGAQQAWQGAGGGASPSAGGASTAAVTGTTVFAAPPAPGASAPHGHSLTQPLLDG